jgi:hypothetical protein
MRRAVIDRWEQADPCHHLLSHPNNLPSHFPAKEPFLMIHDHPPQEELDLMFSDTIPKVVERRRRKRASAKQILQT